MKKLLCCLSAVVLMLVISGCALTPVAPPRGAFFTAQRAPLFPADEIGRAVGTASSHNVLFLFGWGDCSLATAAANGKLLNVKNTEYEFYNIGFFYQRFTTIAYGDPNPNANVDRARR